ncbi:MAG: hypothetical protein Q4E47_01225 [Candidatus Saccharibacteria bacterium]|nr:hypothetical protein [Candidatus Saccharibacteria bacterium]
MHKNWESIVGELSIISETADYATTSTSMEDFNDSFEDIKRGILNIGKLLKEK